MEFLQTNDFLHNGLYQLHDCYEKLHITKLEFMNSYYVVYKRWCCQVVIREHLHLVNSHYYYQFLLMIICYTFGGDLLHTSEILN